jgi:thiamine transport system permease protein
VSGNAFIQAFLSTFISVACANLAVYFFNRFQFRGKSFTLALVPLLCIMPSKIMALGIMSFGIVDGLFAIVWGHAALNIPLAFFMLYSASQIMNPHWNLIAQEFGATRWQAYKDIDLPFLKPTILSSSIIIFLLCFTSFSIPQILRTAEHHLTPDILVSQLYDAHDYVHALFYFIIRLTVLLPLCLVSIKHYGGWLEHAMIDKGHEQYSINRHSFVWIPFLVCVFFIIIAPIAMALFQLCDWNVFTFWHSMIVGSVDSILKVPVYLPIVNSILLALASGFGSVIIGYILCKSLRMIQANCIKKIIALSASAVFLLGSVGCGIVFAWLSNNSFCSKCMAAIICHIILNYPFAYRLIKAQYGSWQSEWDLSAQSFGATARDRWITLELPFLRTSFLQAFCISFGLSLTEVGAGSVLGDASGITIPMAIRLYREQGMQPGVVGLTLILLLLVFGLTLLMGRKAKA